MEEYILEKGCSPLLTLSTAAIIASEAEVDTYAVVTTQ
jgi:hypothetical protein